VIKHVHSRVWAFDVEWIPDPLAGRLLYDIPESVSDPEAIMQAMWREGGASEDDPSPFLKTVLCRVVSVAVLERSVDSGQVELRLKSLPRNPESPEEASEASVIGTFLDALGARQPQLVGFNSISSDLRILVQRGLILGLGAGGFCKRPNKPWEGVDYFARGSDFNVDLKDILGGWGQKVVPSLHEIAVQSGIPGKMDIDGNQVARLWLEGELEKIVQYNEFDALTTYLVWLRLAHFAGHFTEAGYAEEQQRVRDLLESESKRPDGTHLRRYLEEWDRLHTVTREGRRVPEEGGAPGRVRDGGA
jgi:predicted PolB exonuclease-like 3'-5' exonuclease